MRRLRRVDWLVFPSHSHSHISMSTRGSIDTGSSSAAQDLHGTLDNLFGAVTALRELHQVMLDRLRVVQANGRSAFADEELARTMALRAELAPYGGLPSAADDDRAADMRRSCAIGVSMECLKRLRRRRVVRGTAQAVPAVAPELGWSTEEEGTIKCDAFICPICQQDLLEEAPESHVEGRDQPPPSHRPQDVLVVMLEDCQHAFCVSCIETWLHLSSTCPVCRAQVSTPRLQASLRTTADAMPIHGGDRPSATLVSMSVESQCPPTNRRPNSATAAPPLARETVRSLSTRPSSAMLLPRPTTSSLGRPPLPRSRNAAASDDVSARPQVAPRVARPASATRVVPLQQSSLASRCGSAQMRRGLPPDGQFAALRPSSSGATRTVGGFVERRRNDVSAAAAPAPDWSAPARPQSSPGPRAFHTLAAPSGAALSLCLSIRGSSAALNHPAPRRGGTHFL